jgi:molybdate transport system substrate-binding protein
LKAVLTKPILVMSSGSGEPGIDYVARAFEAASGCKVSVIYNSEVERPDVIVASEDAIARKFQPTGRLAGEGVAVGRVALGCGIRNSAPVPDISSVSALSAALLDADNVLLTHNHSSGLYMEALFERLGLTDRLTERIARYENGPRTIEALLAGKGRDLAFLSVNEFFVFSDQGVAVAGLLPEPIQRLREFVVAPAAMASNPAGAGAFVRFCAAEGRAILRNFGFI